HTPLLGEVLAPRKIPDRDGDALADDRDGRRDRLAGPDREVHVDGPGWNELVPRGVTRPVGGVAVCLGPDLLERLRRAREAAEADPEGRIRPAARRARRG